MYWWRTYGRHSEREMVRGREKKEREEGEKEIVYKGERKETKQRSREDRKEETST